MNEKDLQKIDEIMAEMHCPKNFKCAEHGFEQLCKAQDYRIENYIKCLEKSPLDCPFALSFGHDHYCRCPLRVFLEKNRKKIDQQALAEPGR